MRDRPSTARLGVTAPFTIVVVLSAIFVGILAATGELLMMAMGAGLIGGIYLIANARVSVWIVLLIGLIGGAVLAIAGPQYSRLSWGAVIVAFLLWVPVTLALPQRAHVPGFVRLLLGFLLLAILTSAAQFDTLGVFVAGFKRYFQAYGLLMALAILSFTDTDFKQWRIAAAWIALAQLPFAVYERYVLVPLRGGLEHGAVSTDVVAGSFGAALEGGSPNSVMVVFLMLAVAFAYTRWRAGLLAGWKTFSFIVLCLVPAFLGETKIILVLIPLIILVLHRKEFFRRPGLFLFATIGGGGLVVMLAYFYALTMWNLPIEEVIRETVNYNLLYKGHGTNYLNRTTVLNFWWANHSMDDPVAFLFGHGIGSCYTGLLSFAVGHIAVKYAGYGIDLTAASLLLWELGVVGLVLHLSIFALAWRTAGTLAASSLDAATRADALALQAAAAIFVLFHFYSNSIVALLSMEVLVALALGYLAYLARKDSTVRDGTVPPRPAVLG